MNVPAGAQLDFCPRCRIQAPHRPGRLECPRCHGELTVITAGTNRQLRQSTAPRQPAGRRPATRQAARPDRRVFRNPHLRWVAARPPEARPGPRPNARRVGPGRSPIPAYPYVPRWGLGNLPVGWNSAAPLSADAAALVASVFRSVALVFTISAVVHLARYLLLVVNRTRVVPSWADLLTTWLVYFVGVVSIMAVAVAAVAVARWLIAVREERYRSARWLDPRPRWQLWAAVVLPVVNLIGPAWLLHEVVALGASGAGLDVRRRRLRKMAVAWLIVNAVALLAICYRVWGDSIQAQADGLALVVLSSIVSAGFAWWMRDRLTGLFDAPAAAAKAPETRWVIAA